MGIPTIIEETGGDVHEKEKRKFFAACRSERGQRLAALPPAALAERSSLKLARINTYKILEKRASNYL
jgi:hypothetical protein